MESAIVYLCVCLYVQYVCMYVCMSVCLCVCLSVCVCRRLLISDINDLRARQLEEKAASSTQGDEKEDPVVLKLKLA